jgi:hypothetical protein
VHSFIQRPASWVYQRFYLLFMRREGIFTPGLRRLGSGSDGAHVGRSNSTLVRYIKYQWRRK